MANVHQASNDAEDLYADAGSIEPTIIDVDEWTVVSLCDRTGVALRPWAEAGYRCVAVDIERGVAAGDGVHRIVADVRTVALAGAPLGVMAWPPCTHLASSGAQYWPRKGRAALLEALSIADACMRLCRRARWWLIENPVGRLSHYWRTPDHTFDPCEYGGWLTPPGDAWTKKTCLWTGGEFVMPERRPVEPVDGSLIDRIHDADERSVTPRGFARALYETLHVRAALRAPAPLFTGCAFAESARPGPPLPTRAEACAHCGRPITPAHTGGRFCGTNCRVKAWRRRREVRA